MFEGKHKHIQMCLKSVKKKKKKKAKSKNISSAFEETWDSE